MVSLIPYGHSEAELRQHSLDWMRTLANEHRKRLRYEMADQLALASLAAAASQSEEAGQQVQEVLEELRSEEDNPTSHITDPDAKTDFDALAPFLTKQPKEASTNGRPG